MTYAEAFYSLLTGNAGIAALAATRIYPMVVPEQNMDDTRRDTVVFYMTEMVPAAQLLPTDTPLWDVTFAVEATSKTHSGAHALAVAVRDAIHGYAGLFGSPPALTCNHARWLSATDIYDMDLDVYGVQGTVLMRFAS
jgi:hypothetical protein